MQESIDNEEDFYSADLYTRNEAEQIMIDASISLDELFDKHYWNEVHKLENKHAQSMISESDY